MSLSLSSRSMGKRSLAARECVRVDCAHTKSIQQWFMTWVRCDEKKKSQCDSFADVKVLFNGIAKRKFISIFVIVI